MHLIVQYFKKNPEFTIDASFYEFAVLSCTGQEIKETITF